METTTEKVLNLWKEGRSKVEISQILKISKSTVSYHAKKLGIVENVVDNINNVNLWQEIQEFHNAGHSTRECGKKFSINGKTFWNAIKRGIFKPNPKKDPVDINLFMVEKGQKISRKTLKRRLIKEKILENKCFECGTVPFWNGRKLVLHLDHINGIPTDNRLENLRLLCPNCHSQTPTYAGRNVGKNKLFSESKNTEESPNR